jgi:ribosomal protein S27AE
MKHAILTRQDVQQNDPVPDFPLLGGTGRGHKDTPNVHIDAGPLFEHNVWEVRLPPCPDCGGDLLWVEASKGPGARECANCGSVFLVNAE